jgi:hypothetical protein
MQQIDFSTRYEDLLAEAAPGRAMAAVVDDLNDQLDVICGFANLGAETSHDADRTESFFTRIELAGERAAQITRQLQELDLPRPSEDEYARAVSSPRIDATTGPRQFVSSFRRRLTAARAGHEGNAASTGGAARSWPARGR